MGTSFHLIELAIGRKQPVLRASQWELNGRPPAAERGNVETSTTREPLELKVISIGAGTDPSMPKRTGGEAFFRG